MSQLNMNDFNNLGELRTSLISYVDSYNQHIHSSLNGLSPQDRFFSESHMIKRLNDEQIETFFLPIEDSDKFIFDESKAKTPGLMFSFYWFFKNRDKLGIV